MFVRIEKSPNSGLPANVWLTNSASAVAKPSSAHRATNSGSIMMKPSCKM